jgi:hypothetical protein
MRIPHFTSITIEHPNLVFHIDYTFTNIILLYTHHQLNHQLPLQPTPTMSSPATQYVYIPNLVGRQMLRIPLDEVEAEGQISISPAPIKSTSYARDSSPSPSVSSVEETE